MLMTFDNTKDVFTTIFPAHMFFQFWDWGNSFVMLYAIYLIMWLISIPFCAWKKTSTISQIILLWLLHHSCHYVQFRFKKVCTDGCQFLQHLVKQFVLSNSSVEKLTSRVAKPWSKFSIHSKSRSGMVTQDYLFSVQNICHLKFINGNFLTIPSLSMKRNSLFYFILHDKCAQILYMHLMRPA